MSTQGCGLSQPWLQCRHDYCIAQATHRGVLLQKSRVSTLQLSCAILSTGGKWWRHDILCPDDVGKYQGITLALTCMCLLCSTNAGRLRVCTVLHICEQISLYTYMYTFLYVPYIYYTHVFVTHPHACTAMCLCCTFLRSVYTSYFLYVGTHMTHIQCTSCYCKIAKGLQSVQ